ncbi:MAG: 30S ribosomal protein S1 [Bacteroidetes bacterium]|uniref:Small ribosomal subunit protein bS1 n=1 Tax=Phaeocystidibacter marisrubri TaxID=1577780 RepID=A0A6L3ZD05_9FLAO|nr:30S ribosomal protein S1 [Phaeocystidibacter marisrubri]KAB2815743.1 30S ribosomal protein S1 [Phaeocystidibacter marisrubri]TNE30559.1 MAG: 30S ribosomal protein S1 [Bacteroidota bacterium]GGH65487.1 30S ribosomal protein S1 [Phaeocystidibacter marisrubri]
MAEENNKAAEAKAAAAEEKATAAAEVAEVETEETEEEVDLTPVQETEFDWEAYESGTTKRGSAYEELAQMYEDTLGSSVEHQVVNGKVVTITDRDAIIDIASKSEGVVSLNEFRYNPDLKVGDDVEVLVDKQEDKYGQLVLSHRKARAIKAWDRVNEAYEAEEVVNGYVKCRTKGGMIVDVFGLEAFLPGSQIDVKPIRDYDAYVDKTMEFKIVKINQEFKNVVVSHKALIEADLEEQKRKIISQLEKGQVLEGVVKNITSYGVFIDLGGVDGLVHITDLSWSRINHPSEVVELDEKLNVVILDFDEAKTRIQLGIKQLAAHPWDALNENLSVGDKVKGKVVVLADYGAFVEVQPGVEGLIHVSEMSWSTHLRSAQDFVKVGDEVEAVILTLDREDRKMSLGMKQLTPDPWADIQTKYPQGSQHKGIVRNFTNFGVFVELEEGIDGLIHISDLSWTKKIKHPSEFTSIGAELEVKVLEVDLENRRLSLGHKQVQENPWDNYSAVFTVGSVHEGNVTEVFDKGVNVMFETFGVEGFCPGRHAHKEDGSPIKVGDKLDFKVIEFSKDARRIVVSHTQLYKEVAGGAEDHAEATDAKPARATAKKATQNVEKTTLGDLDALAQLKKDMEDGE